MCDLIIQRGCGKALALSIPAYCTVESPGINGPVRPARKKCLVGFYPIAPTGVLWDNYAMINESLFITHLSVGVTTAEIDL
jgi:hypothetical protein